MEKMTYIVIREDKEIDEQLELARDAETNWRTDYPKLSYEEGVRKTIEWILGFSPNLPLTPND